MIYLCKNPIHSSFMKKMVILFLALSIGLISGCSGNLNNNIEETGGTSEIYNKIEKSSEQSVKNEVTSNSSNEERIVEQSNEESSKLSSVEAKSEPSKEVEVSKESKDTVTMTVKNISFELPKGWSLKDDEIEDSYIICPSNNETNDDVTMSISYTRWKDDKWDSDIANMYFSVFDNSYMGHLTYFEDLTIADTYVSKAIISGGITETNTSNLEEYVFKHKDDKYTFAITYHESGSSSYREELRNMVNSMKLL